MDSHLLSSQSGSWTNEKHVHYLNSMEASFVRTMFENNGCLLRLDRYMPDSSESTLDLKSQRRKRHTTSVRMDGRRDMRTRRRSSRHHTSSQDQVVPQIDNRASDNKDEYVPVAPIAPAN